MNERAREALVAAALAGVPQVRYMLFDGKGGLCAGGVLTVAAGAVSILGEDIDNTIDVPRWAGMTLGEWMVMVNANNKLRWDFLTIARKIGVQDDVHPTQEATQ